MNFITLAFFIFLAVAALVYYILPRIARAACLLCCSYVFYLYDPANAGYIVLLCAATLATWGAGLVLELSLIHISNFSASWSRTIYSIYAFSSVPERAVTWKKPW